MGKIFIIAMILTAPPAFANEASDYINDYYDARDKIRQDGDRYYDQAVRDYENTRVKEFEIYQYQDRDGRNGQMLMAPVQ